MVIPFRECSLTVSIENSIEHKTAEGERTLDLDPLKILANTFLENGSL